MSTLKFVLPFPVAIEVIANGETKDFEEYGIAEETIQMIDAFIEHIEPIIKEQCKHISEETLNEGVNFTIKIDDIKDYILKLSENGLSLIEPDNNTVH